MNDLPLRVGQYALINQERKILILQRSRSKKWSLPGGRLESHERDWLVALKREVFEETGIEIEKAEPISVNIVEDSPHQVKYGVYFKANAIDDKKVALTEEHNAFLWVDSGEVESMQFEYPFVKELVQSNLKERS